MAQTLSDLARAARAASPAKRSAMLDEAESALAIERALGGIGELAALMADHPWLAEVNLRWRFSYVTSTSAHERALRVEAHGSVSEVAGDPDSYSRSSMTTVVEQAALAARLADGELEPSDGSGSALSKEAMRAAIQLGLKTPSFTGRAAGRFLAAAKSAERELSKALVWATVNKAEWAPPALLRSGQWEQRVGRLGAKEMAEALGFPALAIEIEHREIGASAQEAPSGGPAKSL